MIDNTLVLGKFLSESMDHHRIYRAFYTTLGGDVSNAGWENISSSEWEHVPRLSHLEGVSSLLYRLFSGSVWPENMPDSIRTKLENNYYSTTAQNTLMYTEIARISEAFRSAQIPLIALKGAANALVLYPEIGLRPMGDMDLLVPKNQLHEAIRVLVDKLDYQSPPERLPDSLDSLVGHDAFLDVRKPGVPILELHWGLIGGDADWRKPDIAWFWSQVQAKELFVVPQTFESILVLNPIANLLLAAAHLMLSHGGFEKRLIWFYDIHRIVSLFGNLLDWEQVIAQSIAFHWATALLASLQAVGELFHTPLPEGILQGLESVDDPRGRQLIYRKGFASRSKVRRAFNKLASMDRKTQFRFFLNQIFPTPGQIRFWYKPRKSWHLPFYYPLRWMRMVDDGIQTILKRR